MTHNDDIIVVREPQTTVVIADPTGTQITTSSPGTQGPPGPPGPPGAGGSHYTYIQTIPSTFWAVTHNLGFRPSVAVLLDDGTVITDGVTVTHIDENSLTVLSGLAISGRAELS